MNDWGNTLVYNGTAISGSNTLAYTFELAGVDTAITGRDWSRLETNQQWLDRRVNEIRVRL